MAFITEAHFSGLAKEAKDLYLDKEIPYLENAPSPLEFHREFVSNNRPVIIRNAINHWPALREWKDHQYLRNAIGKKKVTVAVTPNGYADAVFNNQFVMPEERIMTFNNFLDIIEKKTETAGVFYVQKQNSNLTDEFEELSDDVEPHIPWATKAFDSTPDAVNFWMGDEKAVTSLHKDHYENLYCVISGAKTFTLIPPTDQPFVPYENFRAARYSQEADGEFEVVDEGEMEKVPWIPVDPLDPDLVKYPSFAKASPVKVTVKAGEILYLPSLWYHHVQQTHGCIAVNYWYDMKFDIKYVYYKFVERLCSQGNYCQLKTTNDGKLEQASSANEKGDS